MSAVSSLLEKQNPLSAFSTASVMMDHAFVAPASTSATAKKKAFTNFQTLVEVLKRRIQPLEPHVEVHSPEHIEEIRQLLSEVQINPKEWEQYTHFLRGRYTRTLVGYDERFVALLLCWEKGQRSPIHDHAGASCWVKLLSGELQEVLYDRCPTEGTLTEVKTSAVTPGGDDDVSYMNDKKGLHAIINPSSTEVAVSLHIYAPPFRQCQIFQPLSGEAKTVSMVPENTPSYQGYHNDKDCSGGSGSGGAATVKASLDPQKTAASSAAAAAAAAAEEEVDDHGPLFYPLDTTTPTGKHVANKNLKHGGGGVAPSSSPVCSSSSSPAQGTALLPSLSLEDFVRALKQHEQNSVGSSRSRLTKAVGGADSMIGDAQQFSGRGDEIEEDVMTSAAIAGIMERVNLSQEEWNRYCTPSHFSEFHYTRNLVHITDQYSLMVLCWSPEQSTPPHSHGVGRRSWIKVLHGNLTLDALADDKNTGELSLSPSSPPQQQPETNQQERQNQQQEQQRGVRGSWDLSSSSGVLQEDETLCLHQLANRSETSVAVSLHLYSPPLKELKYTKQDGKHASRPVVCYNLLEHGLDRAKPLDDDLANDGHGVGKEQAKTRSGCLPSSSLSQPLSSCGLPALSAASSGRNLRGTVFTNLDAFAKLCDFEFEGAIKRHRQDVADQADEAEGQGVTAESMMEAAHAPHRARLQELGRRYGAGGASAEEELEEVLKSSRLETRVTEMLKAVQFNTMEWQQYASWDPKHFTRVLLASTPYYSMVLSCWDRGQFSPPHDHAGSRNWMKVLQGNIDEVQFEKRGTAETETETETPTPLSVSRSGTLSSDTVTYLGPSAIHSCLNDNDAPAFTLHLYSPPYTRAHFYDVATGKGVPIDIPLFGQDEHRIEK